MCHHPQRVQREGIIYLMAVSLAGLFMLITSVLVVVNDHKNEQNTAALYGIIAIYCSVVFVYFSFDSIISENRFQFFASLVTAITYTVLVGYKTFSNPESLGTFWMQWRYYIFAVKSFFTVLYIALFKCTIDTFGFYEYKIASADAHLQELYSHFRVFLSLLKVDLFFVILLLMLGSFFLFSGATEGTVVVDAIALGATLLWTLVGWYSVVKELRRANAVFLALAIIEPIFVGYTITNYVNHPDRLFSQRVTLPQYCIIASGALLVRLLLLHAAWRARAGFGEGLRDKVFHKRREHPLNSMTSLLTP